MKTLIVSYADGLGGAGKAAYRLHQGLRRQGVDSWMLVVKKVTDDDRVISAYSNFSLPFVLGKKRVVSTALRPIYGNQEFLSYNLFPGALHRVINKLSPDIVNLHWVNGEMLSLGSIAKITQPIVWTLHDQWLFLGSRHYTPSENTVDSSVRQFVDQRLISRKQKLLERNNIHLATPSAWLHDFGIGTGMISAERIHVVNNGIDLDTFQPSDSITSRSQFGLPKERKLILCGAAAVDSEFKGMNLLNAIADTFHRQAPASAELVVFGGSQTQQTWDLAGMPVNAIGRIDNEADLAKLYGCADAFLLPSRIDNFPNTVIEAAACATATVGNGVGGVPEQIEHMQTGYVAKQDSAEDLAQGLIEVLNTSEAMGKAARQRAEARYSLDIMANNYLNLFESRLGH